MRILVTGAKGQLGADIVNTLSAKGIEHLGTDIEDFNIADKDAVLDFVKTYAPDAAIHCAAYTAVDAAEDNADWCMRTNAEGTENIARACRDIDAEMIYISTDYVFSGEGDSPYETDSNRAPLSIYGKSKLIGEDSVMRNLDRHYIVRTSWVFGENGDNFVETMLKLSKDRDEINVVDDQIGSPTYTVDLAILLCQMVQSGKYGVYHATNEGFCSWAEFACEIMKTSGSACRINQISTEQYPTKAVRPRNSRMSKVSLDNAGFARLPEWKDALGRYFCVK